MQHGFGAANTSLVYHAKKLMCLQEGDLPYAVSAPAHAPVIHAVLTQLACRQACLSSGRVNLLQWPCQNVC